MMTYKVMVKGQKDRFYLVHKDIQTLREASEMARTLSRQQRRIYRVQDHSHNVVFTAHPDGFCVGRTDDEIPKKTPPTFTAEHKLMQIQKADKHFKDEAALVHRAVDRFMPDVIEPPKDAECIACGLPGKIHLGLCPSCLHAVECHGATVEMAESIECDGCSREKRVWKGAANG